MFNSMHQHDNVQVLGWVSGWPSGLRRQTQVLVSCPACSQRLQYERCCVTDGHILKTTQGKNLQHAQKAAAACSPGFTARCASSDVWCASQAHMVAENFARLLQSVPADVQCCLDYIKVANECGLAHTANRTRE